MADDSDDEPLRVQGPYDRFLPGGWNPPLATLVPGGAGVCKIPFARPCPRCKQDQVVYIGSDEQDGSIELCHLIHTEVVNHFRCRACSATWKSLQYL